MYKQAYCDAQFIAVNNIWVILFRNNERHDVTLMALGMIVTENVII